MKLTRDDESSLLTLMRVGNITARRPRLEDASQELDFAPQVGRKQLIGDTTVEMQLTSLAAADNDIPKYFVVFGIGSKEPADWHPEGTTDRMQRLDRWARFASLDLTQESLGQSSLLGQIGDGEVMRTTQVSDLMPHPLIDLQQRLQTHLISGPHDALAIRRAENFWMYRFCETLTFLL